MNTSIRFGPDDRGPDGKILTLDQLLADSKQAMSATAPAADLPAAAPTLALKRPTAKAEQALLLIAALVTIGVVAYLLGSGESAVAPVASEIAPTAVPTSAPLATPSLIPTPAMLPAYRAPDVPLGPIEATRAITPTAHYGQDWIQADVAGSGLIWLRASDWPSLAIVGPDLAPHTPAPAPFVPAAPVVPEEEPPASPTTAPAPTQCAEVHLGGKESRSCGTEDLSVLQERAKQLWVDAFGGNIGSGDIHPTPPPWSKP